MHPPFGPQGVPTPDSQPEPQADSGWRLMDEVENWRFSQLIFAGYPEHQAFRLAMERYVDLHKAVALVRSAGPELAYEILV